MDMTPSEATYAANCARSSWLYPLLNTNWAGPLIVVWLASSCRRRIERLRARGGAL